MNQDLSQRLTRDQLAAKNMWSNFPTSVQEKLFQHYCTFTHGENWRQAEFDVQNATTILYWVVQEVQERQLNGLYEDHTMHFTSESAQDVQRIVEEFKQLRQTDGHEEGA